VAHRAFRLQRGGSRQSTRKIEVAVDKVDSSLHRTPWLAGDTYTLADINFLPLSAAWPSTGFFPG